MSLNRNKLKIETNMINENKNIQILRKIYDDFSKGDMESMLKALSEDFIFYVPGRNKVSGTYFSRNC